MEEHSSSYDFTLTRVQQLCSLVMEWWFLLLGLCFMLAFCIIKNEHPPDPGIACFLIIFFMFLFRGFIFGIVNLFEDGRRHVEIKHWGIGKAGGVGFGRETADRWIFTDGIKQIRKNPCGTTTIRHENGINVDIPTAMLSKRDHEILMDGMMRYFNITIRK